MNWPKPPDDNGRGIHFGEPTPKNLDKYLPLLRQLQVKWLVLASESNDNIGHVATRLLQEGIMPIARPQRYIDRPADFAHLAQTCKSPYVQIYNEPGDDREWKGQKPPNWWDVFIKKWIAQAHRVRSVGCYPGLQVTSIGELEQALVDIEEDDRSLIESMWLSPHLYPTDHCLPWCQEHDYGIYGWEDYIEWAWLMTGLEMPTIVTEGGWTDGQGTPQQRAKWMAEVYEWFKPGGMAPDNLLAFCPFILFGKVWFGFSWVDNINHQPMVEAVKAMKPFVRKVGGEPTEPDHVGEQNWRVVSPWVDYYSAHGIHADLDHEYPEYDWQIEKRGPTFERKH